MIDHIRASFREAEESLKALIANEDAHQNMVKASQLFVDCFNAKGHVYTCGNGGSMCDAMHFAEELSGRYRENRPALGAIAMSDPTHMTCVGNDYGFDYVFSRFVEAQGRAGDILVGISTSGKSPNVIKAVEAAKKIGMKSVVLTGQRGSALGAMADVDICTPAGRYADRVQELHIKVIHTLIELIERQMFGSEYKA
ncbi:MAG: D-sedoheptulose 7-phosphate isomerase [Proteobacteria bacterium]|nr:MAG: D-sedoheptulose 7-phosphate isomerase [Pseudomonadota bacterium]